jgi:hypothetical protein
LGSTHNRNSLRRLVNVHKLEVVVIQESILEVEKAKGLIMTTFLGWNFEAINAEGKFGGMVLGC